VIGQATAHRRANAFAQALDDTVVTGEATGEHGSDGARGEQGAPGTHAAARHADQEQATLLALAASLSSRPRPVLDAEKKTVQRAQLLAAMEQALADGSFAVPARVPEQRGESGRGAHALRKLAPRSRLSRRLAVGGLTVGVAAGAFGGVAAASTNALPGDTLYGLKRGMEDIKLDMANGDASRGKVYLDMAGTRMQEARRLMDRGRGGDLDPESVAEVRRTLSGMHHEVTEGHRLLSQAYQQDGSLQSMETLNRFTATNRVGWSELAGKLPSQLTDVSDQVSSAFAAIDQEVAPLESMLPAPHEGKGKHAAPGGDSGTGRTGSAGGTGGGRSSTSSASPSTTASAGIPARPGDGGAQSATPAPSQTAPNGLIGGSGNLLDQSPPPTSPEGPSSPPTTPTHHSVTLPPLLPGLLPGLGLTDDDDSDG
jgi:hypothetical protein